MAAEQTAHDEIFREKQSLQRFRVIAVAVLDAVLAGRADQPEFAELVVIVKDAAAAIDRGELFTACRDEPDKEARLDALTDALARP